MKKHSAIFHGQVRHCRTQPVEHHFDYHIFMMYLDLDELPDVFAASRLFSVTRRSIARFCREDHLGDITTPLDEAVRDLVEQKTSVRPTGPIRLLTHLRYFGYVFNPVSFYYCFDSDDTRVETIVAEVNNTPWGERHCYVLSQKDSEGAESSCCHYPVKKMHVSPFMPMDVDYDWHFTLPSERLTVRMGCSRQGRKLFDASLVLDRREITHRTLAGVLLTYPLMTLKVMAAIHWQALKLWLKRCPVYDHPGKPSGPHALLERNK